MNNKQTKKHRKRQRRVLNQQVVKVFDDIMTWPLKDRLKLAWGIVKGKKAPKVKVK
ncbi:MAG: hypothetical protein OQJ95_01225 [Kangiella sp.]|nr:hypothetical protein [Kangiella sp.]MCW9029250.1 hypothetical protein [Kangiella sp.]